MLDIMPKKGKAGSTFGRKSASTGAKAKAKQREDEDYAAEERKKQQELMALRRQHSDEREKQRFYEEERRKSKKFRENEKEKDRQAYRKSRDLLLDRKKAEKEHQDAIINENQAKLFDIHLRRFRQYNLVSFSKDLGFDFRRCEDLSYMIPWLKELRKTDFIECFRFDFEWMWGAKCHSPSENSCERCDNSHGYLRLALHTRARFLLISRDWSDEALKVIKDGPQCIACLHVPVPHGMRYDYSLEPCKRCQVSKDVRAKLIDFWNHMQASWGKTTKFGSFHTRFECVCEKEAEPIPEDEHGSSSYEFCSDVFLSTWNSEQEEEAEEEEEEEEEEAMEEEQQQHQGEDGAKSSRARKFVGKIRSVFE